MNKYLVLLSGCLILLSHSLCVAQETSFKLEGCDFFHPALCELPRFKNHFIQHCKPKKIRLSQYAHWENCQQTSTVGGQEALEAHLAELLSVDQIPDQRNPIVFFFSTLKDFGDSVAAGLGTNLNLGFVVGSSLPRLGTIKERRNRKRLIYGIIRSCRRECLRSPSKMHPKILEFCKTACPSKLRR